VVGDDQAGRAVSFVVALPLEVVVTVSFSFSGAGSFFHFMETYSYIMNYMHPFQVYNRQERSSSMAERRRKWFPIIYSPMLEMRTFNGEDENFHR
jgi:hypothetical protein